MVKRTGQRIGRGGIAVLVVLTSLLLQGSVRADRQLTVNEQNRLNRATIGLLQQGKNLVDVLDFIVKVEDCFRTSDADTCDAMTKAGTKLGLGSNPVDFLDDLNSLGGLTGFWFVYEGFTNTTGRITVGPSQPGSGSFSGTAKFSPSGTADFTFYPDSDGNYDFDYRNNLGDHGTGYLIWTPEGCHLVGIFISDTFTDANGKFNSAILTFRRC